MLTRRELVMGGLVLATMPTGNSLKEFLEKTLGSFGQPYYAQYTLKGLLSVASLSTNGGEQNDALSRLRQRMKMFEYDNLMLTQDGVVSYRSKIGLTRLLEYGTAVVQRDSIPYDVLTDGIPRHKKIVTANAALIAFLPEVRTPNDSATFDTIGTIIRPDVMIIQSVGPSHSLTEPQLYGLLVHEADHLANHESKLLLLERRAYEREWETLCAYRERTGDVSVNERIAHANRVVMRADYLKAIDSAFDRLHPGVLDANALRIANIPKETLEKIYTRKRKNAFDDELWSAANEILNPPKPDKDLALWVAAERPVKPSAPQRIPDYPDGDQVKML